MILDFACSDTKKFFISGHSERFHSIEGLALRKLDLLQCACSPRDLQNKASSQALDGAAGSISVGEGWHIFFSWAGNSVRGVRLAQKQLQIKTPASLPAENAVRIVSHPGAILREEFMIPLGLSSNQVSIAISVPVSRMLDIVNERRGISSDTASRLSRYLGISARLWTSLQSEYELSVIRQDKRDLLDKIKAYA
ncbi:MAG: HigA family addiction module antidote protein [Mailhella sp.]|nr:HigA family addiction module antidote protein [Mailhella sp.]